MGANEYVDDPSNVLAKHDSGKALRLKVKITLAYDPGQAPSPDGGHINNLVVSVHCPSGI